MGNRRKRNKIKWSEFVEHSKVAGVDMDKAKFSSEAREVGSKLYKYATQMLKYCRSLRETANELYRTTSV